ncbi:hypothetical protein [Mesorhizobium sp. M0435]|uniref:hypothetical protein n=1 Tax=unclassified Mesorhizobium TaxID=325217 RepID=UPI00333570D0
MTKKSKMVCAIFLILPTIVMAQERRQLYRLTEAARPFKGYLLPGQKGMPVSTNFQTCAGQQLLIETSKLTKESGSCDDPSDTGTMMVDDKSILGAAIYMAGARPADHDQQLGTILKVEVGDKGTISDVVVKPAELSGIGTKEIKIDHNDIDFQTQPDGSYYIRVLKTQAELKAASQK